MAQAQSSEAAPCTVCPPSMPQSSIHRANRRARGQQASVAAASVLVPSPRASVPCRGTTTSGVTSPHPLQCSPRMNVCLLENPAKPHPCRRHTRYRDSIQAGLRYRSRRPQAKKALARPRVLTNLSCASPRPNCCGHPLQGIPRTECGHEGFIAFEAKAHM